jgi:hypothetical protein
VASRQELLKDIQAPLNFTFKSTVEWSVRFITILVRLKSAALSRNDSFYGQYAQ